MKTLLEDYQRRLVTVDEMIETTSNSGSINDVAKMARLNTKASEYRAFIVEIERAIERETGESEESDTRQQRLNKLSVSDLSALEKLTQEKMNYYQRRLPADRVKNEKKYEEIYPLWVKWYGLFVAVVHALDTYVDKNYFKITK